MKFAIFSSILFAVICTIQAHDLELNLILSHNGVEPVSGKVSVTLNGKTTNKDLVFNKNEINKYEKLTLTTEFPEDVQTATISWKADLEEKTLQVGYLLVIVDDYDEMINFKVAQTSLESGKSVEFSRM